MLLGGGLAGGSSLEAIVNVVLAFFRVRKRVVLALITLVMLGLFRA